MLRVMHPTVLPPEALAPYGAMALKSRTVAHASVPGRNLKFFALFVLLGVVICVSCCPMRGVSHLSACQSRRRVRAPYY